MARTSWFVGPFRGNKQWKVRRDKQSLEARTTAFINGITKPHDDLMRDVSRAAVTKQIGRHRWDCESKRPIAPTGLSKRFAELRQSLRAERNRRLWASRFQKAWDKPEMMKRLLETVFSPRRLARIDYVKGEDPKSALDQYGKPLFNDGAGEKPIHHYRSVGDRRRRSPFQISLGAVSFEPRDDLDRFAYAILRASERGLLRKCEGEKRGWECPTPYLIADESRRVYCYMRCGHEANKRAKREWWKRNLSAGARKRSKGREASSSC